MDFTTLKNQSITDFIKEHSGFAGQNFYTELYEEDLNEFIELSDKLKEMTENRFEFDSINMSPNTLTLKKGSDVISIDFENNQVLGLCGQGYEKQLQYFKVLNELLKKRDIEERFFLYYDHLEPDTHWVGFLNKDLTHKFYAFLEETEPTDLSDWADDDVRVLGIGLADEDYNSYKELVILPG